MGARGVSTPTVVSCSSDSGRDSGNSSYSGGSSSSSSRSSECDASNHPPPSLVACPRANHAAATFAQQDHLGSASILCAYTVLLMLLYLPASLKESKLFRDIAVRKGDRCRARGRPPWVVSELVVFFCFFSRTRLDTTCIYIYIIYLVYIFIYGAARLGSMAARR